ncbi:hypothetical protein BIT28_19030 [Photobacterium proteolyticum]|uniref:Glycosyl transferase family 1 domain-containing protein n=1 Tax=Photobacterium proteolyticum TaxID=1903952 RepID=A0A1Q9GN92_9GAMM|nr:glycosyltransferase family 4 protein [Photobacterium proteolyticum]OLQ76109.1 hypothetical protein BIT28_19030 [Photobacterium proteolyticum]
MSNKLNVIQVYQTDPSLNDQGGGIRYVCNLTTNLLKRNIGITFLGVGKKNYSDRELNFIKVDSSVRGYLSFGIKLFKYSLNRTLLLGKVVHVHRLYYGLPFSLFSWFTGCKVICTLHGRTFEVFKDKNSTIASKLVFPLFYFIEYLSLRLVDEVIPVSQDVIDSFIEKYPSLESKIAVIDNIIPSMLNLSDFNELPSKEDSLRELGLSTDFRYLCFIGRFAKVKDIPFIINLVNENKCYFSKNSIKVILCGHGEDFEEVKLSINQLGLNVFFHLTGVVESAEIKHVYNSSELTLICSKHEAGPTVLIESIAANTPVVSNDVGEVKEVLSAGRVGVLTDKTTESYFYAIKTVLEQDNFFDLNTGIKITNSRGSESITDKYIEKYMGLFKK